jgi:cytochrome c
MRNLILILSVLFLLISCKNNNEETIKISNINIADSIIIDGNFKMGVEKFEITTLKELKAKNIYIKHCKFCHGETGEGNGIKARLDTTLCPYNLKKENNTDKNVYYIILNGSNKMPNQKELSENEIWVLVIYIKELKKEL